MASRLPELLGRARDLCAERDRLVEAVAERWVAALRGQRLSSEDLDELWAGLTEAEAKDKKIDFVIRKMPWSASGRAVALGRTDGVTKLIFDKSTQRLLGIGLTGPHAGEMISEGVLALEMGAVAYDLAAMIHPHPTLSETIGEAAGGIEKVESGK